MSVTLHWWYLPVVLAIIPVVYVQFRRSGGDFDMPIDSMMITFLCWGLSAGLIVGHFL